MSDTSITTDTATTPRVWFKKPHWRVSWPDPELEGGSIVKEYATIAAMARDHNLSPDTLRHMVNNTVVGRAVKSDRYRKFTIEKIAKTPGRVSSLDKACDYAWCPQSNLESNL